ncbi:GIY-YIG nuclease family protein [Methylocapsa palsarum]|nr:hypothetical protein [Methylocapsa palsarum]
MTDLPKVKDHLLSSRFGADDLPPEDGTGVYAFFLAGSTVLAGMRAEPRGLIYVGAAESSADVRDQFACADSGFSTLRRSLGALLKEQLRLRAIPRGLPQSKATRNYRFCDNSELRLALWMRANLRYGFILVPREVKSVARALIADLGPPLNLIHWPNPQGPYLRALRAICRDEAHRFLGSPGNDRAALPEFEAGTPRLFRGD